MDTGYKYKSQKVLESISTEGYGSTNPGDTYLSHFPDTYYNISIIPVVHPCILVRYFNTCNYIEKHNKMQKYDLELEKYWVPQSGCFRLAITVLLGMGITGATLLFFRGIINQNRYN